MTGIGTTPLYHGTYRVIERFRASRYEGAVGAYFTASLDEAWSHAQCSCLEDEDVPTVICAKVDIRNPVRLYGIESQEISEEDAAAYLSAGFDGAVGVDSAGRIYEYVAFDPDQIVIEEVLQERLEETRAFAK